MEVSISGYYAWIKRPESALQQENKQIVEQIKLIHKQSRETGSDADARLLVHGSPRIYQDLQEKGISCSQNRVARLMKKHKIAAKRKRRFMVTTDSNHSLPVAENILNQTFQASKPNIKVGN